MKQIAVIGTGYVGLVTGTCFAEMGNQVICIDNNQQKVAQMQAGNIPIYEPELDVLFERNIKAGRLLFTTNLAEGIAQATSRRTPSSAERDPEPQANNEGDGPVPP